MLCLGRVGFDQGRGILELCHQGVNVGFQLEDLWLVGLLFHMIKLFNKCDGLFLCDLLGN